MQGNPATSRREWLAIGGATLAGAVLRCWEFHRLSLTHFDEGVYAFSGLWIVADRGTLGLDPEIIPYAPPAFPLLVGLAYLAAGVRDLSAIGAATVCGVLTIPAVGWLGRRTFGPGAGAASALLAALSMAHLAFSRKALTDAPFLLACVIAIALGGRFLERPRPGRALALGLAVGLAQNVKYNGWLVGIVVLLTVAAGALIHPDERGIRPLLRTLGFGLLAALAASLFYAPWFGFVCMNNPGGYAALLRHHRGYSGGLTSWWPFLGAQLDQSAALSGPMAWRSVGWALAGLGAALVIRGARGMTGVGRVGVLVFLGGLVLSAFWPNLPWWAGLVGCPGLIASRCQARRLVGVWWVVLSSFTPLYHPYARLWLPVHAIGWLLIGGLLARLGAGPEGWPGRWRSIAAGVLLVGFLASLARTPAPSPLPLQRVVEPDDAASFRQLADTWLPARPLGGRPLRMLARRPLAFYLGVRDGARFEAEPDLASLLGPGAADAWALVDEAMLIQEGEGLDATLRLLRRWKPEWAFEVEADPVTLLDVEPHEATDPRPRRVFQVWVLSPRAPSGQDPQ
jgi:4-amino-4-deoxy-L-arabinose transferase-like glycosyltransferase